MQTWAVIWLQSLPWQMVLKKLNNTFKYVHVVWIWCRHQNNNNPSRPFYRQAKIVSKIMFTIDTSCIALDSSIFVPFIYCILSAGHSAFQFRRMYTVNSQVSLHIFTTRPVLTFHDISRFLWKIADLTLMHSENTGADLIHFKETRFFSMPHLNCNISFEKFVWAENKITLLPIIRTVLVRQF